MTDLIQEAQIAARSKMYLNSAREAFERAKARAFGIPELPAYPGDGQTVCLCITSPESKVLTARGWLSLLDVQVGDLAFTHKRRWRPVTGLVVKPSAPYHRQARLVGPGSSVSCTHNHLWYTRHGWMDSTYIDSSSVLCYHLLREVKHGEKDVSNVRYAFVEPEQARPLSVMSVGVSLREAQGLSGSGVYIVRDESQGQGSVGRPNNRPEDQRRNSPGQQEPSHTPGGLGQEEVATQARRSPLQLVLARGRQSQEDNLSLPMDMGYGAWLNPRRTRTPSSQQGSDRRSPGKPGTDDGARSLQAAWSNSQVQLQETVVDVPVVWNTVPEVPPFEECRPEVLLGELLPPGTAVYDLTVEEDHSFIIEGFVAHNTSCRCSWRFEELHDDEGNVIGWNCYWEMINDKGTCPDCIENAAKWNPLSIAVGEIVTEGGTR